MATRKNTGTPTLNAPEASSQLASRRVEEAGDRLDENLPLACAIADALKVLTALERSESNDNATMSTGAGMADGHTLIDVTTPELASHLGTLIEQIGEDANAMREEADLLLSREKRHHDMAKAGTNG